MGATLALCCCGCRNYGCCWCCAADDAHPENVSDMSSLLEDSKNWKTGDILLEHYTSVYARTLSTITNSLWNHIGLIYIDTEDENKMKFVEVTLKGVSNYEISDHAEWFLSQNANHYIGYRALNESLTEDQLQKFKDGFNALKDKKYDNSWSQVGAACDCCEGPGGYCVKMCNDKANEKQRLEKLFCSELSAEILQRTGIMKKDIESDEYTPGDFDKERETKWIHEPFKYGDIKVYIFSVCSGELASNIMSASALKLAAYTISLILFIVSLIFGALVIYHLQKERTENTSDSERKHSVTENFYHYFASTSQFTIICNILCCLSVSMYCFLIIIDNTDRGVIWFIALRATVSICWFLSKVSLIWLYNGRLYYTFIRSVLASSRALFIAINITIVITAPLCLSFGFIGVYYEIMWLISLGFEAFRLIYIVLALVLLIMFTKRLLWIQRMVMDSSQSCIEDEHDDEDILTFVNIASKNAILVLFISISAILVVIAWAIHDYVLVMNSVALLLPLLMFSFDSALDSCCIYLLFNFGEHLYQIFCKSCDECCKQMFAKEMVIRQTTLVTKSFETPTRPTTDI